MKKIFLSLAVIFAAVAIVIGATSAVFNDTEESTGNTFTASQLDLIVNVNGETMTSPIFNEEDIVPGDTGSKEFEIGVEGAAACGVATVNFSSDQENGCTEPEGDDEANCEDNELGELNDEMVFGIYAADGTTLLASGQFTEDSEYSLGEIPAMENSGNFVVKWELPEGTDNSVQTDSFSGDLVITATQKTGACAPMGEI